MMIAAIPYASTGALPDTPLAKPPDNPMAKQDQCIRQAQDGNLEAFNELVLIYQDRVFRQALWILNDEATAEDACQEVFLHAYRKINTFRGGSFRAWLLRITTNYCLDQIKAARRRPCQPLESVTVEGVYTP